MTCIIIYIYIYICQDGGAVGFVDFTELLFALSSLAQPLKRVRSIPEHFFVIINQRKAWAWRFWEETAGKTGPITRSAAPEASVHSVRNRLCYHFFLYQTNESCSESVSRRRMLLISFNKCCLRVTAPNVTEAERPFYARSQHLSVCVRARQLNSYLASCVCVSVWCVCMFASVWCVCVCLCVCVCVSVYACVRVFDVCVSSI